MQSKVKTPLFHPLTKLWLIGVICALIQASARADLVFESETAHFALPQSAREAALVFTFRNNGKSPVDITTVRADCGCTVPSITKTHYKPGESGQLDVDFRFEMRTGKQWKQIFVEWMETDSKRPRVTKLTINGDIKDSIDLSTGMLIWAKGAAVETKAVTITVRDKDVMVLDLHPPIETFTTVLSEPKINKKTGALTYKLTVTPRSTGERAQGSIELRYNAPYVASSLIYLEIR